MNLHLLLPPACVIALGACSATTPAPAAASEYSPAIAAPESPAPAKIAETPRPLAAIGQILPQPSTTAAREAGPPALRVDAANRSALREPSRHFYLNAVQVYPYDEGAIYQLYAAPERVTDIALQPGEALIAVAAGDTVRWVVGDTTSGAGEAQRTHILVKPFAPGLSTNLVITTDRRSYHLALTSTAATAMAAISWTYPHDELLALAKAKSESEQAAPVASGFAIENLRFGYVISGDGPPWRPVRAFDDGRQVFIEFPATIAQGEAPPLFVLGPKGDAQLVNYRVAGRYYIVDRLFDDAELRLGERPQQIVRISREADRQNRRRRKS